MPRAALNEDQITQTRERILDIAADIINEEGYAALSMRKIGTRAGMTAANLYNYYSNKDEINIAIRLRAGRFLYQALLAAYGSEQDLTARIRQMISAYVRFGLEKPNYYAIMFDLPTPRYADYVGTPLESLAAQEKEESEQSVALMRQCIDELEAQGFGIPHDPDLFLTLIWAQFHGLVSLYNNHALAEIVSAPKAIVAAAADAAWELFLRQTRPQGD